MAKVQKNNRRTGQAMLITVLSLGGAILGATTVAGFLTFYQIRATTDTENSAKAIFAADAGNEWARFQYYCNNIQGAVGCGSVGPLTVLAGSGATVNVTCYDNTEAVGGEVPCSSANTQAAISTGESLSSERAFYLSIATSTTPVYP